MPLLSRLTCQQMVELVTDYFEGALPRRARARFERHLRGCPGCRAYLDQMRTTLAVLGRLEPGDVPAPMMDDLLEAFRGWQDR